MGFLLDRVTECIPFKKALNICNARIALAISNLLLDNFLYNPAMQIYQKYEYQPGLFFTGIYGFKQNIARIANAVPFSLYSRVTMNDEIVVLNC